MMKYKEYTGHFSYYEDADIFHGKIIGIRDVITFQGRSLDELKTALHDSIDDYLEMCEKHGKMPDKPFSGKFSLRIPPELHEQVASAAMGTQESLNTWITEAIKTALPLYNS
ncbi:MAG: type II toxin-antitoxin system HicB family antitoxin [Spirochaetales bacterium]|nr:type II toxin-antitoxin system HicB family antitoxin [Spirochaetales bacterium]